MNREIFRAKLLAHKIVSVNATLFRFSGGLDKWLLIFMRLLTEAWHEWVRLPDEWWFQGKLKGFLRLVGNCKKNIFKCNFNSNDPKLKATGRFQSFQNFMGINLYHTLPKTPLKCQKLVCKQQKRYRYNQSHKKKPIDQLNAVFPLDLHNSFHANSFNKLFISKWIYSLQCPQTFLSPYDHINDKLT